MYYTAPIGAKILYNVKAKEMETLFHPKKLMRSRFELTGFRSPLHDRLDIFLADEIKLSVTVILLVGSYSNTFCCC